MSNFKHTVRNNHSMTAVSVALIVYVCVMTDSRSSHSQWGDFLRQESWQGARDEGRGTSFTPRPSPLTPRPSSHIADDWYRFETTNIEPLLTPREQHYLDRLIELDLTDLAEFYCRKRIASYSVALAQEAGYTRTLLQLKKQELLNAPPYNREHVWGQIEQLCTDTGARFIDTPYAVAVLLLQVNVRLAYVALLIDDVIASEVADDDVWLQIAERINTMIALIDSELERIAGHIANQPASPTTNPETTTLMTFAQLLRFRKTVALRLLARCRPEQKSALTSQALAILQTMSDPRQGEVSVFASFEAIACFRMTQQFDEALPFADQLRNNVSLTPRQRVQLTAVDLLLAVDRCDENRVHSVLRTVETALHQQQLVPIDMPGLLLAQLQAYLFFWKRNIETQSSLPQIVGTTTAPNIDECRRRVLEIMQRLEHDCAPYWHQRAGRVMLAESRFFGNDPVFVEQRADAFAREGRIDEAIERYDRLSAAALATNPAESFRIAKKSADLLAAMLLADDAETKPDTQAVIDRYRKLAVTHSKYIDAVDAHLAAVYYAARRLQAGDESKLEDYLTLLREHFQTWPHSKQADSLRVQTARLLMHQSKYRDAINTLAPLTNRSSVALEVIQVVDACFDLLRLVRPDAKASLENEAVSLFYHRLTNANGEIVADWNDADAHCLLCMAKYCLLYANVIERNKVSNPNVNLPAMYQSVEQVLRIGLANYKQATAEWRAAVDSMLLCILVAQGRTDDAAQILQTMWQWDVVSLVAALDRLQQLADISPATNRRTFGEMRLDIVQVLEQQLQTINVAQQNADTSINRRKLDVIRADALADIGKSQEAVDLLGQLLRQSPGELELLVPLAEILERQPDAPSHETALKIWRSIEGSSPKYSEVWWEAKEAVIRLLVATGRRQEAESTLQMLQILTPELGGPGRKLRLVSLMPQ